MSLGRIHAAVRHFATILLEDTTAPARLATVAMGSTVLVCIYYLSIGGHMERRFNEITYLDVDECNATKSICNDMYCNNTFGSYQCFPCAPGFEIQNEKCVGTYISSLFFPSFTLFYILLRLLLLFNIIHRHQRVSCCQQWRM